MLKYLEQFNEASSETKQFILTVVFFLLIIFGGVGYAYLRLDSVRSYDTYKPDSEISSPATK
jgi:hypothetical protein